MKLYSPINQEVPLENVATIEEDKTPDTITSRDDRVYASVTVDVKGNNIRKISSDQEQSVQNLKLPSSVEVSFEGITRQMDDTFTQMGMAMLAAIAILYFLLF